MAAASEDVAASIRAALNLGQVAAEKPAEARNIIRQIVSTGGAAGGKQCKISKKNRR